MWRASVLACAGLLLAGRPGAAAPVPEAKLTAARLAEAFLTNEAYADEHYVGKQVEMAGKVVRVSRSKYGPPAEAGREEYALGLDLEGAGKGAKTDLELLLFFDAKARAQLAQLKVGQRVVVRGHCDRRIIWSAEARNRERDYSEVHLRDCSLVGGK